MSPSSPPQDPAVTAQELRVAVGRVARRLRRITALNSDGDGLSFTQAIILVRLAREGSMSPSALAAHEQVTTQAIAGIVRELEVRKLVTRGSDPSDGRRTVIKISKAGRTALWDHDQAIVGALLDALAESFSDVEVRRLSAAIPLLNRLAEII